VSHLKFLLVALAGVAALLVASSAADATRVTYSMGENTYGAAAQPRDRPYIPVPTATSGLPELVSISSGAESALGAAADGAVWEWGYEEAVGFGAPRRVPGGIDSAVAVAASFWGSEGPNLALLADGSVMAWGSGSYGQLGDESTSASEKPVAVSGVTEATAVASGGGFGLALLSDGTVMAWGDDEAGQLGDGATKRYDDVPARVEGLTEVVAIAAGGEDGYALLRDGEVRAWGSDEDGQLGNGGDADSATPVPVSGIGSAEAIAAGAYSAYALVGGRVEAWGDGASGRLGDGSESSSSTPVSVSALSAVTRIAAGGAHAFALEADGKLEAWGADEGDELGIGYEQAAVKTPRTVACSLEGVEAISTGREASLVLASNQGGCPAIKDVSPDEGPPAGGNEVTITGFGLGGATAVRFGLAPAQSYESEGPERITAVAPEGAETVEVSVTTPIARSEADGHLNYYTYAVTPVVTSVVPDPRESEDPEYPLPLRVVVQGRALGNAETVYFGRLAVHEVNVLSTTEIEVKVPEGVHGTVPVTVETPAGTSVASHADQYTEWERPEYGTCRFVGVPAGTFVLGSDCGEVGVPELLAFGTNEWYPAFGANHPLTDKAFTLFSGEAVEIQSGATTISCSGAAGVGAYTGNKTLTVQLTLRGCGLADVGACHSSGAAAGAVALAPLDGLAGIIADSKPKAAGVELSAASGGALAEFSCGGETATLSGSLVIEVPSDEQLVLESWRAQESDGVAVSALEGSPAAGLRLALGSGEARLAALGATLSVANGQAVTLNRSV